LPGGNFHTPFARELRSGLTTRIFGRRIYHLTQIDSTNNFALQKAREGAPDGTLILADCQTGGRGQGDHTWYSPRGGIYLSLVLRPDVAPVDINSWNLMAGRAVRQTIREYTEGEVSLKFPNDVLIDGRKVAGILTEMRGDFQRINYLVMGIGINLNFEEQHLPEELRPLVATLRLDRAGESTEGAGEGVSDKSSGDSIKSGGGSDKSGGDSIRIEIVRKLLENLERLYISFLDLTGEQRAFGC
jgi:BirA family biotin operon repressor/biotin-[acetyl-CoA-carboxylase] ligase